MNWNRGLRMVRTPGVSAAIVAGAVGAALLAGPLTGAQAAQYPESYWNGGFCYQNPEGQENKYRLQVTEIEYDPSIEWVAFSFLPQKWDGKSNQYRDDAPAFKPRKGRMSKLLLVDNTRYGDANAFCKTMTEDEPDLRGDLYSYGVWTSRHEPASGPAPAPGPGTGPTGPSEGSPIDVP